MSSSIKLLRLKDVTDKTGLARSTIYDRLNNSSPRYDNTFPKSIKIGKSAVGWFEHEVDAWLIAQSNLR